MDVLSPSQKKSNTSYNALVRSVTFFSGWREYHFNGTLYPREITFGSDPRITSIFSISRVNPRDLPPSQACVTTQSVATLSRIK